MTDVLDLTNTTDLLGDPLSFATAEAAWKVSRYSGSGALLDLTGNGHDLTFGSTSGADTNDPLWLPYTGTAHIYLPGTSGNYASVPDSAALNILGDIDIDVHAALADWTPSAVNGLAIKWTSGTDLEWRFTVLTTGALRFTWYDGAAGQARDSTASVGATDGDWRYARVALDVDNGAGGHDVKFYLSTDGSTWTQLGATVTTAGTTQIRTGGTAPVEISGNSTAEYLTGSVRRVRIYNGIRDSGGTLAFDCDFTDLTKYASGNGSLTEKSANAATVTLNRSASGRKLAVVDRSLLLLGTDDYLETPDAADLDFGASDSFTVLVAVRKYGTSAGEVIMSKRDSTTTTNAGYHLGINASLQVAARIADGTNSVAPSTAASLTTGVAGVLALARSVAADAFTAYLNGAAGTAATDTTTATLANALALRIGRSAGVATGYFDGEFIGAALYRYALTADECVREGRKLLAA